MNRNGRFWRSGEGVGKSSTGSSNAGNGNGGGTSGLSNVLEEMLDNIKSELGNSPDLKIRHVLLAGAVPVKAAAVHFSELANADSVNQFVVGSLLEVSVETFKDGEGGSANLPDYILNRALEIGQASRKEVWNEVLLALLSGETLILLDGYSAVISCETTGGEWRAVGEPSSQLVVRGPKDSFVESVATNVSLIRRRIKSPKLRLEYMKIGSVTQTYVALMFIQDTVDDKLLAEVKLRLNRIKIDAVLESGYIEELIQDKTFTPFPTVYNTERPDSAVANLLEGRVVLIVDGTPFILVLPAVFTQFFQSSDDYAQRFDISLLMRIIRYISFIVLMLGPAVYIALTTYHYEMIPTTLLISLLAQRENVPFPAFVEALLMEGAIEILREAGVRMPRAVGQTVSVVGALILGQAVVEAGIITPVMVIVVALTGIASFAIPAYNMSIAGRLIRFVFLFLAGMFGFFGITLGMIVLVAHMNSLRSFGIPYLSPIVPPSLKSRKDTILRLPLWAKGASKSRHTTGASVPQGKMINSGHEENLSPKIPEEHAETTGPMEGKEQHE
ncbi:spore gernimation protein KB [Bacillus sp. FJAT-27264]|uniref:spore germination protein n=1 Tax=Paenibacillus sp. (strain DSM 101736 / FJAT-27264) TaxID=1850362 RepID=UPI000808057A|nr:spore germination protein [Bacillus sp. FJAT-27264]OBZ14541.1 spore gernimation protein KB [Bacillus sp. FJAT-27264]